MPEKTKTIYDRLAEIQLSLKAPKGQYNAFAKFNYRSCEDILLAVKPLLKGLTLILDDEIVQVGERYYVKAVAKLSDGEKTIVAKAYARESVDKKGMDDSQITGAASSYARKYALNGLFAIDDTKDADSQKPSRDGADKRLNTAIKKTTETINGLKCPICGSTNNFHAKTCKHYKTPEELKKMKLEEDKPGVPGRGIDGQIG